jgi:hypothetical protein
MLRWNALRAIDFLSLRSKDLAASHAIQQVMLRIMMVEKIVTLQDGVRFSPKSYAVEVRTTACADHPSKFVKLFGRVVMVGQCQAFGLVNGIFGLKAASAARRPSPELLFATSNADS